MSTDQKYISYLVSREGTQPGHNYRNKVLQKLEETKVTLIKVVFDIEITIIEVSFNTTIQDQIYFHFLMDYLVILIRGTFHLINRWLKTNDWTPNFSWRFLSLVFFFEKRKRWMTLDIYVTIMCHNDELSWWLFTNILSTTYLIRES